MQSTLLSRPNLAEVARAVFPGLDANNEIMVEAKTDSLKSRTVVEAEGKKLFRIAHINSDPRFAKDVVQAFLNIFVEGNLGQDRSDIENAQSFIAKQLAIYEQQLRDTEKRIAEFKAKNSDVISASRGSFSQQLEKALADVDQANSGASAKQNSERSLPPQKPPQPSSDASAEDVVVDASPASLDELRAELNRKRAIYSDQHPDVVSLKRQIETLEAQNARTAAQRLALANETLKRLQDMASSAGVVETQMADLNRDYAVLKQKYDELRERAESARISHDARTDTASLRFRIIEPPETPARPSGPKRTLLLLAVLLASIGGGVALAFLLSEMDDSFSTPRRLREAFNLPLLGSVCLVPSKSDAEKRYLDAMAVSVGTGSMVVLCALLIALTSDLFHSVINLTPLRQLANSLLGTGA